MNEADRQAPAARATPPEASPHESGALDAGPAIVTQRLRRSFGAVTAIADITLTIGQGETFGLLGHNGAGKTTLVRLLNGLLRPDRGRLEVLGLDPQTDGPDLRARSGVLTETPALDERLSARENLTVFAEIFGLARDRLAHRVDELLEMFALDDRADDAVGEFSRGMKQRLALARTLLHDPELLYLDEPTAGLDPLAARQVQELIEGWGADRGRTVLLCTHNLIEAQRLCDRVAVLQRGQLIALGTPAELARRWGEQVTLNLEVAAGRRQAALNLLQERSYLASVIDGVIQLPGVGRDATPDLVNLLVHAGIPLYRVTPDEPTLEDVYMALHRTAPERRSQS